MSTPLPICTIVAAVDLEDDLGDGVLRSAAALSERFGAKLHVIDIWPALEGVGFPYAKMAQAAELKQYQAKRDERTQALERRVKRIAPHAVTMTPIGETADTIIQYLQNEKADLLVIGSHQKGFWGKLFGGGSVSEEALHDAPCAVFLVPPPFAKRLIA